MFSTLFADPAADEEEDSEASGRNIIVSNTYEFNLNVADDEFNANKKSLFATFIWSGSIKLAEKLVEYKDSINGRSVLEFGAAAGLPSLVCGRLSAELVCSSDYPSKSVIDVLRRNIDVNTKHTRCGTGDNGKFGRDTTEYHIVEHIWGEDASPLKMANHNRKYDIILAAECLSRCFYYVDPEHYLCWRDVVTVIFAPYCWFRGLRLGLFG